MKQWIGLGVLLSLAVCGPMARAVEAEPTARFSTQPNPNSGLRGWHLDRPSADRYPHGISFDLNAVPLWEIGIDFEMPDLVLAYSHVARADQIRLRPDTGQIDLGPRVGHPVTQNQVNVTAGTETAPLDGIGVGVYGNRSGLYLYQKDRRSARVKLHLNGLFQIGTDSPKDGTEDLWIYNNASNQFPLKITDGDSVVIERGLTVGAGLRHVGPTAGFYNAPPTRRPRITGSRSDGTALANLLAKLRELGLIDDSSRR